MRYTISEFGTQEQRSLGSGPRFSARRAATFTTDPDRTKLSRHRVKVLLCRPEIEALENATGRVEQNDIRLWLAERLGIERYQFARNPYRFKG